MQPVNAISLAPDVRDWLANSHHPRVLHLFDQVCNLINERKEVLSIVTPQIGDGPFNLVVEEDVFVSRNLSLESQISIFPNQLILADLTINTVAAKLWNPRPDRERLHARKDEISNQLMSLSLPNSQLSIPNFLVSNLSSALANADISTAKTVASQLAGLGQGLTPSGDDFIMGAIYATWIIHPPDIAKDLAREIADTAAPLTTSLSAAWLRSAGRGEAGILWHDFFDTLLSADSGSTQYTIDKILTVGETSGFDSMSGFIDTLLCWQEMKSS
jgi:hypothetical protein